MIRWDEMIESKIKTMTFNLKIDDEKKKKKGHTSKSYIWLFNAHDLYLLVVIIFIVKYIFLISIARIIDKII